MSEERGHSKIGRQQSQEEERDQKADVKRNSAEERVRQYRHEQADYGEHRKETKHAGENDGNGVAHAKLQEHSERTLRADYGHGEKDEAGGVYVYGERDGKQENGGEISEKDSAERDGQRDNVRVIAAVQK